MTTQSTTNQILISGSTPVWNGITYIFSQGSLSGDITTNVISNSIPLVLDSNTCLCNFTFSLSNTNKNYIFFGPLTNGTYQVTTTGTSSTYWLGQISIVNYTNGSATQTGINLNGNFGQGSSNMSLAQGVWFGTNTLPGASPGYGNVAGWYMEFATNNNGQQLYTLKVNQIA